MANTEIEWHRPIDPSDGPTLRRMVESDVLGRLLSGCPNERFFGIGDGTRVGNLALLNMPNTYWFDAFKILAKHAKAILILPEDSESLLEEVAYVVDHHESKILVLMPPNQPGMRRPSADDTFVFVTQELDRKPLWENAQRAFSSLGLTLPDYDPRGGFLHFAGARRFCQNLHSWSGERLARMLRNAPAPHGSARAALSELRRVGIPLVSIPAPRRKTNSRIAGAPEPSISQEEAIDASEILGPYQTEKRRQKAGLAQLIRALTGKEP
jgi:hypothetical protein